MSQSKAHPDPKKQTTHSSERGKLEETGVDVVPASEHASHDHSHAAHLQEDGNKHAVGGNNKRQGAAPGALRQPASVQERNGK